MKQSSKYVAPEITAGFCCISNALKRRGVSFRGLTLAGMQGKTAAGKAAAVSKTVLHNCRTLRKILEFCGESGIRHHRISSSAFPLMSHPELRLDFTGLPDFPEISEELKGCGRAASELGISLSMHPGQYDVIASRSPAVRENSVRDINLHSAFMDLLGLPRTPEAPINIHMNSSPAGRDFAADFNAGLDALSPAARSRLSIENEDRGHWTVSALLEFLEPFGIPVALDFLHRKCNPCALSEREAFERCLKTWGGFAPVFHFAESKSPEEPRSHSDFCAPPPSFGIPYICEIEAKAKDDALLKILRPARRPGRAK